MINDNERLLQQFFSEAANQQIEDNGFTERVMQSLPVASQRAWLSRFSKLWTIFCVSVFAVLFVVFHGWELRILLSAPRVLFLSTPSFIINLMMLFSGVFGLLFVGTGEVISSELSRKYFSAQ